MQRRLRPGSWRELLGRQHLGAAVVLSGGVALYATNEFMTASLLPSTVADIGGQPLYSWVTTVYLVSSVVAATTVSPLLDRLGPRRSYLFALAIFSAGTIACATASSIEVLLVGRTVQGLGGGLLTGLGYAVINAAMPESLWTRASALVSAMWGVGTLIGPAVGGLFAQFGLWRCGFGTLVILSAGMSVLVLMAIPDGRQGSDDKASRSPIEIPIWSLLILGSAALVVSVAGIQHNATLSVGLLVLAVMLVGGFVVVDRRLPASVFPPSTFRPGPLKWIYLTMGLLMATSLVDMYMPFFGQHLAGLLPVTAGFLGAALAIGWTLSEVVSASLDSVRLIVRLVTAAPLVMAGGLALAALVQRDGASASVTVVWAVALLISGAGIGVAWPHLSAWAMASVGDPAEGGAAAAASNTVQLIAGAFGAGLAGMVVNLAGGGDAAAARWMLAVFAALAALGVVASYRSCSALRGASPKQPPPGSNGLTPAPTPSRTWVIDPTNLEQL